MTTSVTCELSSRSKTSATFQKPFSLESLIVTESVLSPLIFPGLPQWQDSTTIHCISDAGLFLSSSLEAYVVPILCSILHSKPIMTFQNLTHSIGCWPPTGARLLFITPSFLLSKSSPPGRFLQNSWLPAGGLSLEYSFTVLPGNTSQMILHQ